MKLLTINCHSWQEENQIEKIKTIAKDIKENHYDFIALQEVSQSINSKKLAKGIKEDNYLEVLVKELKNIGEGQYQYIWDYAHIGYEVYEEGLGILSKHKLIDRETIVLTESKSKEFWKSRIAIRGDYSYQGKVISIYSCHLGWWKDKDECFKNQVRNLINDVNDRENQCFIMGDFNNNAFIREEGYDYIIKEGLRDSYTLAKDKDNGVTVRGKVDGWEENKEELRIDLILSNKELEFLESKVKFNGINEEVVSDHFGVKVEINF